MKKNILFVIDSLSSGGAEKSLVSLLTLFDYSKYNVDLLMFSKKGLYLPLLPKEVNVLDVPNYLKNQEKGIKYLISKNKIKELYLRLRVSIDIRRPSLNKKLHEAQISWRWIRKGIEEINKPYDVAIAYSQGMPTYYVAEKINAKKKVCWVNTDYSKAPYNKNFDIKYYDKFEHIVAVSELARKSFLNKLPIMKSKVTVIYDIISSSLIENMSKEINSGFKDNYNGIRILTIGRLVQLKGYDLAIEAAFRLKEKGIDFRWYSIGEGACKHDLEDMVKKYGLEDRFIFLGTTINPYTYLKQCDIYVQPSRYEGFGMSIAEAKILRKKIIATKFDTVYNQLKHNFNGLIVEMNSESIYKAIISIIQDEKLSRRLIKHLSNENFGTDKEIQKVNDLL